MNVEKWREVLNRYDEKLKPHCKNILAANTPYPEEIPEPPDTLLKTGASESEITDLEKRFGVSLPLSYREFLRVSNGMNLLDLDQQLLPASEVDWVKNSIPWILPEEDQDHIADEHYFVYGPEQDCINVRLEYLHKCIAISTEQDGFAYLLNPCIESEGEWEAWDHGWKYPGAFRYQSFWALFNELYSGLQDRIA